MYSYELYTVPHKDQKWLRGREPYCNTITNPHLHYFSFNIDVDYKYYMYLNCSFQHSVLSVLPRLDDTEELVGATNSWMESACAMQNANFWDVTDNFPYSRTELWKWKDQIHLSVNFGLPLLMDIIFKISMEPKREGMVPIQTTCLPWLQKKLRNFWKAPVKRALGKSNYVWQYFYYVLRVDDIQLRRTIKYIYI